MKGQLRKPVIHILPTWVIGAMRYLLVVFLSLVAVPRSVTYSLHGQEPSVTSPSLDSILDSLEQTAEQSTARAHAYEVTREYKVFHGDEPNPISDVTAQINFILPDIKTFKIIDVQGRSIGKTIVNGILAQELTSAKSHGSDNLAPPIAASSALSP